MQKHTPVRSELAKFLTKKRDNHNGDKNIPFNAKEMQEAFEVNPKDRLMNEYPNRSARRAEMEKPDNRPVRNNRGNAGLAVYRKMSYFYLTGGRNPLNLKRTA